MQPGQAKVFIDGAVVSDAEAKISVWDRGFLYGDSVYEVTRTVGGRPVDLQRHLDRLERSARHLLFPPLPRAAIESAVAATLSALGCEAYLRIIVTRGEGEIGLDPALGGPPRLVILARPLVLPPERAYRDGIAVVVVGTERMSRRALDPAIKSGNYLNNVLGLAEAKRAGADEALFLGPDGSVVEGSTSNVFVVEAGASLATPAPELGLLDGITRGRVIELACGLGLPVAEERILPDRLTRAAECFITSSIRGILPVTRIDGALVGSGEPGPVTRRLMEAWSAFLVHVRDGQV